MKFKRIIAAVLVLCLTVCLASCNSGDPKKVVDGFMKALAEYDVNAMAKYVEDIPTNSNSIYKYDVFTSGYYVDLYQMANKDIFSYKIVSVKNNAVKVKVKMPDIYTLYSNTLMSLVSQTFANEDLLNFVLDEENDPQLMLIALMINAAENGDVGTVEEEFVLKIGKINGEYKIMTNDQLEQLMTSKLCLVQKDVLSEITE